jgi:hypothetical protein
MAVLGFKETSQLTSIVGTDSNGIETNYVNATVNGDLGVVDGISGGGVFGNISLTTANTAYEVKVGASRLTNRKLITVVCIDADVYWGYSSSVTTTNGFPLFKNQIATWEIDPTDSSTQVWVVCSQASKNLRVTEAP